VDEAHELSLRVLQLDPNFPTWIYFTEAIYFYRKHRYREAADAADQIAMPDFYQTHFWRALTYAQLGDQEKARSEIREVLRLKPDFSFVDDSKIWNNPRQYADHIAEGARKAGLPLPSADARP
jgi:tetratricopeptide (TPR) repeat protein